MKTIWRVSVFICFTFFTYSLFAQPTNTTVGEVVLPAPNAGALGKYGDIPVSLYTGTPDISIPIYTIQEPGISLPIALSYHASGIRVAETASWVGIGWSLQAGGMITRTTQAGDDDNYGYGYYHHGASDMALSSLMTVAEYLDGVKDAEPDIYSFNFSGYSGKFFFDNNQNYHFVPKQDLKLETNLDDGSTGSFEQFTITTPDGVRYTFGTDPVDVPERKAMEFSYSNGEAFNKTTASSWYLVRVESPDQQNYIKLMYEEEAYSYKSLASRRYIHAAYTGGCSGATDGVEHSLLPGLDLNHHYVRTDIIGKRLSQIISNSGTSIIDFVPSATNREDLELGQNGTYKKLDEIKITSGSYCSTYKLTHDYFHDEVTTYKDEPFAKRLKLLSVQQIKCGSGNSLVIPPYVFEYEELIKEGVSFLPHRLNKGLDHWGFYNGADGSKNGRVNNENLIVNTPSTSIDLNGTLYQYGTAYREPDFDYSKIGTIKKITYPTGGHTEYTFESNKYLGQIPNGPPVNRIHLDNNYCIIDNDYDITECCGLYELEDTYSFTSLEQIADMTFRLHFSPGCSANVYSVRVEAYRVSDDHYMGGMGFDGANTNIFSLSVLADHGQFLPTETYRFELEVVNGAGSFTLIETPTVSGSKDTGGLRIQQIKSHDAISMGNDIIKSYSYLDENGLESGRIAYQPFYAISMNYPAWCNTALSGGGGTWSNNYGFTNVAGVVFYDQSYVPLSSFDGRHVVYSEAKESLNGIGYKTYKFNTSIDPINYYSPTYPASPAYLDSYAGKPLQVSQYNSSDTKVAETITTGHPDRLTTVLPQFLYKFTSGIVFQANPSGGMGGGSSSSLIQVYFNTPYQMQTSIYRVAQTEEILDGVSTITNYEYNGNGHFFPTSTEMTNSDGKVYGTTTQYPPDISLSGTEGEANDSMISKYMIGIPIQTKRFVNYNLKGGTLNLHKNFNGFPRLHRAQEIYKDNTVRDLVSLDYNSAGNITEVNRLGEPMTTYEWDNNLVTAKNVLDWKWTYEYYPGTRMLQSSTDLNEIESTYTYDGLSRLVEASGRNGGLLTTYDYQYTLASGGTKNHIASYDAALKQWTYQYFDGLGRDLQSVQKQYSPKHRDVINAGLYDAYGRMYLQYLPYEGGGEGNYVDPYGPKTRFTFEASPLSREVKRTFADNSKVTTTYSSNSTGEVNGYDPNTLYKEVVTDENGHKTETFTDKIGQLILTRRYVDFNDKVDTYNQYDGRGNLIGVMPPETSNSSDPAAYKYTYDTYNRLETKKIPGAGTQSFTYHPDNGSTSDNKLASSTDAKGIALSYTYDAYGRQGSILKAGELMIGNTYDEGSGAVKGKLTKEEVGSLSGSGALATTYQYDQYGRLNATNIQNHQGGIDAFNNSYYGATDIVENLTKVHNGFIKVRERYTYDHSFRLKETWHKVNRDPWVLLSDQGYNHRDELIGKGIGGEKSEFLQSIGYYYNVRGWLEGINLLPLDKREHLAFSGACLSPEDSVRSRECAYDVDLETLLEVRQLEDINVNCFDPCAVAPTIGPVSSLTNNPEDIEAQALSMTVVDNMVATTTAASLTYPTNMYKVDLYEGSRLLLEQELAYVKGGFVIEECAALTNSEQVLDLDYGGEGTVQRSVGQLLSVRSSQSPSFVSPSATCDYNLACQSFFGLCNLGPELGGAIQLGLQAGLASTDPNQVTLLTQLYLIQFCDSSTAYYLEEELSMIPGMYATLQEITVTALDQLFTIVGSNGTQTLTFVEMINLRNTGYEFLIDGYGCAVTYLTQEADCNYRIEQENWVYSNVDNSVQIRVDYDQVIYRDCGNGPEEYSREATSSFIGNSNGKKEVGYQIPFSLGNGFIQSMKLATLNPSDEITVVLHPDSVLLAYPGLSINPSDLYFTNTALFKNALQRVLDYAIANWALSSGIPTPNYLLQIQVSPTAILVYFQVIHNPAGPYVAVNPENSLIKYSPNGETIFDLTANVINTGVSWTTFYETPCGSSIAVSAYEDELFDTNLPNVWHNLPLASPNPERSLYKLLPDNANCPANTVINLSTSCVDPICIWLGGGHQICCEDTTGCVNCPPPGGTCPETEKVTAVSVESSQAFANHNQDTTADLREHHALSGLSRVEDDSPWLLRGFDTNDYQQAEVAWDVGRLFLNDGDISIQSWSASVKVPNYFAEGIDVKFGLAVDEALLPLSGGGLFVNLTSAGTLSLNPQDSLSVSQVENIQVVMLVDINSTIATDSFSIDGVWVDITFDGDCPENCVVPGPTCSEEQVIAQLASLDSLRRMMDTLAMQGVMAIPFPTNLNRVILCDGSAIYLFDHELDILQGGFTIVQTIPIGGTGGTYTVGSGGGSNSENENLDIEDLFGMELHYQDPNYPLQAFPQYNGNIAWTKWQVKGRDQHYYGYRYDELDRLKRATFGEDIGNQGMQVTNKYTVDSEGAGNSVGQFPTIQYDKRGNILKLRRSGGIGGCEPDGSGGFGWAYTDILDYTYASNNQLINLTDENQLQGGIKYSSSNFEYDANGNLIKDPGKDITEIKYNHLNLPNKITFTQGTTENVIEFSYDAKGTKQVKKVNGTPVKEYLPTGVEYDGDKIEAIYTSEGRVIPMYNPVITDLIDSFRYEWVIRDHLGNGRVYFGDLNEDGQIKVGGLESEVMQESHYYPFGLNHEGPFYATQPTANQYQYNGKELNEEFGLNWLDYGLRWYDPAVGRFPNVDPIASDYSYVTPYNYAENEPVGHIDLWGLQKEDPPYKDDSGMMGIAHTIQEGANKVQGAINKTKGIIGDVVEGGKSAMSALAKDVTSLIIGGATSEESGGINFESENGQGQGTLDTDESAPHVDIDELTTGAKRPSGGAENIMKTMDKANSAIGLDEYEIVNQGVVNETTGAHKVTSSKDGDTLHFDATRPGETSFTRVVKRKKGLVPSLNSRDSVEVKIKK